MNFSSGRKIMKNIINLMCYMMILGLLIFVAGCKKSETREHSGGKTPASSPEKPAFNPDEPAPVPEGTPKY